jgi:hypothetical protein
LRGNSPRLADLCAQWRVIDRPQKLAVVLRIIEMDFYMSCTFNT